MCPGNADTLTGFICQLTNLAQAAVPVLAALAFLFFVWGIGQWILNVSDTEKHKEGRQRMIWGLVALFFILSIAGLLAVLENTFLPGDGSLPPIVNVRDIPQLTVTPSSDDLSGSNAPDSGGGLNQPDDLSTPFRFGITQFCFFGVGPGCTITPSFTPSSGGPTLGSPSGNISSGGGSSGGSSSGGSSGSSSGSSGGGGGSSNSPSQSSGLSHADAVAQLAVAGIRINNAPLVGVHRTNTPSALDLTGISQALVDGLIELRNDCGCSVELHGIANEGSRTEFGGLNSTGNSVGLRPNPALVTYVESQRQVGLFQGHYSYASADSCQSFSVLTQADKFEGKGPSVFFAVSTSASCN